MILGPDAWDSETKCFESEIEFEVRDAKSREEWAAYIESRSKEIIVEGRAEKIQVMSQQEGRGRTRVENNEPHIKRDHGAVKRVGTSKKIKTGSDGGAERNVKTIGDRGRDGADETANR